jgi:hypothetical protein
VAPSTTPLGPGWPPPAPSGQRAASGIRLTRRLHASMPPPHAPSLLRGPPPSSAILCSARLPKLTEAMVASRRQPNPPSVPWHPTEGQAPSSITFTASSSSMDIGTGRSGELVVVLLLACYWGLDFYRSRYAQFLHEFDTRAKVLLSDTRIGMHHRSNRESRYFRRHDAMSLSSVLVDQIPITNLLPTPVSGCVGMDTQRMKLITR